MALSAKLQFKQSQSLVMTPQLVQSIKLLQLNNLELANFIEQEIEKNPVLELADSSMDYVRGEQADAGSSDSSGETTTPVSEQVSAGLAVDQAENTVSAQPDSALENVYDAGTAGADGNVAAPQSVGSDPWKSTSTSSGGSFDSDANDLEAFVADTVSLHEHLAGQIGIGFSETTDRAIALELVASLDDDGYLRRPTEEVAATLGIDEARVLDVLKTVQRFDPVGVAARDLGECLKRQLQEKNRFDPAMEALIANLGRLAKRDYANLLKICGVSNNDLVDMITEIRELEPRPASRFDSTPIAQVVPDVFVNSREDGGWSIELNQETLPRVLVNQTYYAEVSKVVNSDADKQFMVDCLESANWLSKSLDQRAQTILKVTTEIVKQQDMFFAYGVEHLRPLNLKTVADAIKMHESTVSRVTSNKYVMTTRGMFELKYFFTSTISGTEGEASHSAEAVRHKIKQLIAQETSKTVLSDDAIVDLLKQDGVDIARRTVAKYREAMHIPSSVQRRRELNNAEITKTAS